MTNYKNITQKLENMNKSFIFLYPLLKIENINPLQTYMGLEGYTLTKPLICMFWKEQKGLTKFLADIESHHMYDFHYENEDYIYVVFTFLSKPDTYDKVKDGAYSAIKGEDKYTVIWGDHRDFVMPAFEPKKHYAQFAKDFNCNVYDLIRNESELVSKPNKESEYLSCNKQIESLLHTLEIEKEVV